MAVRDGALPIRIDSCASMLSLLRSGNLLLAATYFWLSALPFLPLAFGRPLGQPLRLVAMEAVAWVTVWALCKSPARFHWLLLPAFLAAPLEIYLQMYFSQGMSTHHLGIMLESSPAEALEFLGSRMWLLGAAEAGAVAWWWLSWRAAWRTRDLDWTDGSRGVAILMLGAAAGLWAYEQMAGAVPAAKTASPPSAAFAPLPALPSWARVPFDAHAFGTTWPFGLAVRGYEFWQERRHLAELVRKSARFRFGARQVDGADVPQVVVMVIGESSRYDRWGLNGYARETTPLLQRESNLVSLSDVVTAVSATRLSVPILVSRKPARQSLQAGFAEKSFLSAFREAGFKTYWLSNQMSFGKFDTPISVFAKEADVTQFLNLGGLSDRSSHDDILLAPLRSALADAAPKKLIVLHTLGNHWNYSHRHPKEFDRWQPSLFGIDKPPHTDLKLKRQINNSYDNSILYADWFLAQVIGALKESGRIATMMYVADHGQTLYDGSCRLAFHGHNTQFEFHVPALVWYSDQYRLAQPDKVEQLWRNRDARLTTENVFHSLVDMAGIRYNGEQLEWSFFSAQLKPHKRYVDSYGWTDYDNANFKGDCREVIDKGKPLRRE